jgi:hypothetical protein
MRRQTCPNEPIGGAARLGASRPAVAMVVWESSRLNNWASVADWFRDGFALSAACGLGGMRSHVPRTAVLVHPGTRTHRLVCALAVQLEARSM